jgi:hypothetical protein
MQIARGPVLKITPKVTPQFRSNRRKDSQVHATAAMLQPQSPPSLRLKDQHTDMTMTHGSGPTEDSAGGMGGEMDEFLLQQVTALLAVCSLILVIRIPCFISWQQCLTGDRLNPNSLL